MFCANLWSHLRGPPVWRSDILQTSETYFGYLVDLLSDLNQQTLTRALFPILLSPKMAIVCIFFDKRDPSFVSRTATSCKQK